MRSKKFRTDRTTYVDTNGVIWEEEDLEKHHYIIEKTYDSYQKEGRIIWHKALKRVRIGALKPTQTKLF